MCLQKQFHNRPDSALVRCVSNTFFYKHNPSNPVHVQKSTKASLRNNGPQCESHLESNPVIHTTAAKRPPHPYVMETSYGHFLATWANPLSQPEPTQPKLRVTFS